MRNFGGRKYKSYSGETLKDVTLSIKIDDVRVIGWEKGEGKHLGRMGALVTEKGKVGTGFSDKEREEYTEEYILGKVIEVSCMELTPQGKFRFPKFVRTRLDRE